MRVVRRLRDHQRDVAPLAETDLAADLGVVEEFRAAHADPLTRVATDLRQRVADVSAGEPGVGQRLKRMATILDKLEREPTMALSRMNDIAGCRAVVAKQATVDVLIDRLRAASGWELLPKTWDYVAEPKPDGYRAKHLVAVADGVRVEIQLRTAPAGAIDPAPRGRGHVPEPNCDWASASARRNASATSAASSARGA